jgi:CO/xanthine dehydrogenase FAD-binding subunit
MVPAAFDYRAPTSLPEALELLGQHGEEARGSAAYKKDVVRVFVQRGLRAVVARALEDV